MNKSQLPFATRVALATREIEDSVRALHSDAVDESAFPRRCDGCKHWSSALVDAGHGVCKRVRSIDEAQIGVHAGLQEPGAPLAYVDCARFQSATLNTKADFSCALWEAKA